MLTKKDQRSRRAQQTRRRIALQSVARLTVHRTNLHIYASVVSDDGKRVLASASTLEADVRKELGGDGKAARARAATSLRRRSSASASPRRRRRPGVERVAFDPRRIRVPRPRQGARRRCARSRPPVLIGNKAWRSFIPARRPKATTTA
jgi:large subunit ribosomal protein L18